MIQITAEGNAIDQVAQAVAQATREELEGAELPVHDDLDPNVMYFAPEAFCFWETAPNVYEGLNLPKPDSDGFTYATLAQWLHNMGHGCLKENGEPDCFVLTMESQFLSRGRSGKIDAATMNELLGQMHEAPVPQGRLINVVAHAEDGTRSWYKMDIDESGEYVSLKTPSKATAEGITLSDMFCRQMWGGVQCERQQAAAD